MKATFLAPRRLSALLLAGTALPLLALAAAPAGAASAREGTLVVAQAAPAAGEEAPGQRRRERQGGEAGQGAGGRGGAEGAQGAPGRGNAEGGQGAGAQGRGNAEGGQGAGAQGRGNAEGAQGRGNAEGAQGGARRDRAEEPAPRRGAGGAQPAEPATPSRPGAEPATPARPAGAAPAERPAERTPSRTAPETTAPGRGGPARPDAARSPSPESPADTAPRGRQDRPAAGTDRPRANDNQPGADRPRANDAAPGADRPDRARGNEATPAGPAPQTRPDQRGSGDQTAPGRTQPADALQPGRPGAEPSRRGGTEPGRPGAEPGRAGGTEPGRQGADPGRAGTEPGRQGGEPGRQGGQGAAEPGRQGNTEPARQGNTEPARQGADRERDRVRDQRFAPGLATGERRDVRVEELRSLRRERSEDGGRRVVIEEPGNRIIVREGNRVVIRHDETERFRESYRNAQVRTERRGTEEVTIVRRADGVEIVTVRDARGNLIRRVRREPAGREVVLIENVSRGQGRARATVIEEVVNLAPVRVQIPREKYIVEVERASQADLVEAFTAPPLERIERRYTLDEVRQSQSLRERMRRVDLDTVTFASGSWTLSEDQAGGLEGIAQAIERALRQSPNEIFLIEGHTDLVGDNIDNLTLSDRRAETVALVLSDRFNIPAENLTTQGYGEEDPKVNTDGPERQNRRVTFRRITPLLQQEAAR
ncbi:MAG TPA: OmpA family protein [Microvirga sp.]|jgi:outer membrane protein OmpA-like peptidoglycan-associated protein|nr:OmpA family protein [Microvirga sp.]